ncbi:MAG: 4-alpha-glucanotransferase [Candidatus Nanopelagicales bacterium]
MAIWQAPHPEVVELAHALGVATEYFDQSGNHVAISQLTLEKVLAALKVDVKTAQGRKAAWDRINNDAWRRMLPHVVVCKQGEEKHFQVHVPDGAPVVVWVDLEQGGRQPLAQVDRYIPPRMIDGTLVGEATFATKSDLPLGWHTITAISEADPKNPMTASSVLVVTPSYLELPSKMRDRKTWGLMAQMYATRSEHSWGIGDLRDLATLSQWGGKQGAGFVLVNPMHAAEVSAPMAPSPYLPATRRFFNPIYLSIETIPEFMKIDAKSRKKIEELAQRVKPMNATSDLLDRDAVWTAKKSALEILLQDPLSNVRQSAFDAYKKSEGEGLELFALWCTIAEQYGITIEKWPKGLATPTSSDISSFKKKNGSRIDFYEKLQWLLDEQFAQAQAAAKAAGMNAGIVHDLAVGVHPEGSDAWALRDVLATSVSVGAPPDQFNQLGQDWSQPPWRPDALEAAAYIPYRDMLRTILRHSGGIRVDHALGLFRLWWIPLGLSAAEGTYVKYDHEALVGILALEAMRVGAFVVGEDLGTVEPWIQRYLESRGILGTSILWFEKEGDGPRVPEHWRSLCFGTVTVHDIPPTAGFIDGEHIRMRQSLGLLARDVEDEWADHRRDQAQWEALLKTRGYLEEVSWRKPPSVQQLIEAYHRVLAHTPCKLVAVAVPDLIGDVKAQNQPGTDQEYPNWRVPTCHPDGQAFLLEQLENSPAVVDRAERLIAALNHRRHW